MYRPGLLLSSLVLLLAHCLSAAENATEVAPAVLVIPVVNASAPVNQSAVAAVNASKSGSDFSASVPVGPDAPPNSSWMANARMSGPPLPPASMDQQPRMSLPVVAEAARGKGPNTVVKDDPNSCYTCNSFEDTVNKCKKPEQLQMVTCPGNPSGQRVCHHIVGTHTNNKKVEKNIVIAGCGHAPPVNLPEIPVPIHSTFNGHEIKCTPFTFEHDDQGGAKKSNQAIKFIGNSCNCEGSLCNSYSEYSKHFSNSGIASKTTSFFSIVSSVFCVVLFSVALRA